MKLKDKYKIALEALETLNGIYTGVRYENPHIVVKMALKTLIKPKTSILKKVKGIKWTKSSFR